MIKLNFGKTLKKNIKLTNDSINKYKIFGYIFSRYLALEHFYQQSHQETFKFQLSTLKLFKITDKYLYIFNLFRQITIKVSVAIYINLILE